MAGALILGVVYALDIQDRDDPALAIAEETAHAFSEMIDKTYLGTSSLEPCIRLPMLNEYQLTSYRFVCNPKFTTHCYNCSDKTC